MPDSSPSAYATAPPSSTVPLTPFSLSIPETDLDDLKKLLRLARIPKETFENVHAADDGDGFGITREWLVDTRKVWLDTFDWRKQEKRINALPTYTTQVKNEDGLEYTIHFAALFSRKKDAVPILLSHGWPGLYLEFLPILERVQKQYSPEELPYHLIAPSLPGWLYSSAPPKDREFSIKDVAYLFDALMRGLGFEDGYIAQGGDLGTFISAELGKSYPTCKAIHLNMFSCPFPPPSVPEAKDFPPTPTAAQQMELMQKFGYALEQGSRPSTVGLVVGSSPLSLLAWIGEKYLAWSDKDLDLDTILTFTSLYWLTDTYPSSIYAYRYTYGSLRKAPKWSDEYLPARTGYSYFPAELNEVPVHWVKAKANLVWSKEHKDGGHFAALEKPDELWADIEEFVAQVWNKE